MSKTWKVAAVAHDGGGQKVLGGVVNDMQRRNGETLSPTFDIHTFFSPKDGRPEELMNRMADSLDSYHAILFGGPSSKYPQAELAIAAAYKKVRPHGNVVLVEDSPGTSRRAHGHGEVFDAVAVAAEKVIPWAMEGGLPNVYFPGTPSHFKTDVELMEAAKAMPLPRKRLPSGAEANIAQSDLIIGISGGKSLPEIMTKMIASVKQAAKALGIFDRIVLDLLLHPGEDKNPIFEHKRLQALQDISHVVQQADPQKRRKTTHAVAQDHAVLFAGAVGPTDSYIGSYVEDTAAMGYLYDSQGRVKNELKRQVGVERWFPEELGHVMPIHGFAQVRSALSILLGLDQDGAKFKQPKMKRPTDWDESHRKIVDYLLQRLFQL